MPRDSIESLTALAFYRLPRDSIECLTVWAFYRLPRHSIECLVPHIACNIYTYIKIQWRALSSQGYYGHTMGSGAPEVYRTQSPWWPSASCGPQITRSMLGESNTVESRSGAALLDWLMDDNISQLSTIVQHAQQPSLPKTMIESLIDRTGNETACVQLLICKLSPVVWGAQSAVKQSFASRSLDDSLFDSFYAFLPSMGDFERYSKSCESQFPACPLIDVMEGVPQGGRMWSGRRRRSLACDFAVRTGRFLCRFGNMLWSCFVTVEVLTMLQLQFVRDGR